MDVMEDILTRGVANIIPERASLRARLKSGEKLNVYLGIDPTATHIHLGHAVALRKLAAFAELGHSVTFLIGDFTALIGDTSDKDTERPVLTRDQIRENFKTYKEQAEKFIDFRHVTLRFNSEWLGDLSFADIISLCQHFSAGEFVSREIIRNRLSAATHVGLHELLYPVMQGYDSYFLDCDIQIGGTDQTFNMQAGRILQKDFRNKESYIVATEFLAGTDGRKMSKTWGNAIWLDSAPDDMFGKVMSLSDSVILPYLTLATSLPMDTITEMSTRIAKGVNPMTVKKELALQIVTELHSPAKAVSAKHRFEQAFQKRDLSAISLPSITLISGATVSDALGVPPFDRSKTEAKHLITAGSVSMNDHTLTLPDTKNLVHDGDIIRVGKQFGKVTLKKRTV